MADFTKMTKAQIIDEYNKLKAKKDEAQKEDFLRKM